jgi:multidrug efflux pump subunit AcrB
MVATRWLLLALVLLLVLLLLGGKVLGRAKPIPGQAVSVGLCVAEQDVKRVAREVHDPVLKALKMVPGAGGMGSRTTYGETHLLVPFKDGATSKDRAAVEDALKRVAFASDIEILSMRVELVQPLTDGRFPGGPGCTEQLGQKR